VSEAEPQRPSYDELASLLANRAAKIVELEARIAEPTTEVVELKRRLGRIPPTVPGLRRLGKDQGVSGDATGSVRRSGLQAH
jgi:uncharacterized protein involved in exopolysaccharide biosynthesis